METTGDGTRRTLIPKESNQSLLQKSKPETTARFRKGDSRSQAATAPAPEGGRQFTRDLKVDRCSAEILPDPSPEEEYYGDYEDQEYEADMLGVRYLENAGYDPYAAADFLHSMNAQDQLEAKMAGAAHDASQNNWLSSHPATPERVAAARRHAQDTGAPPSGRARSRDAYLSAIDGMLYGDDPSEGVVRDRTFIHPVLRFSFEAPPGFTVMNAPSAVAIQGPQRSVAKFDAGRKAAGMEIGQYLANEWAQGVRLGGLERFTVNGMKAATATTKIGDYNARLVVIEFSEDRVYRFLTGTLPQAGQQYDSAMREMVLSFRKISAAEARAVKPLRIRIVTARAGDNIGTLASRMVHSEFQADRFRVLNGLEPGQRVSAGERFKIVSD